MAKAGLVGKHILVAEDEYVVAMEIRDELARNGAEVIGPVASVENVLDLLDTNDRIDAAILDINLQGELVFRAADHLLARDVPFVFATGYDQSIIPDRFQAISRCEKPMEADKILDAVANAVAGS